MKANNLIINVLLLICMLFTACMDVEVSTILNPDGSIDRTIEVQSDSKLKSYAELPLPVDSTWNEEYTVDSLNNDKKHIYRLTRHYENAEQLNAEYHNNSYGLKKFELNVNVSTKFRWFYTYVTYSESFKKMAKGDYKPFNQYLSDIEIEIRKLKGTDSIKQVLNLDSVKIVDFQKNINEKYEKWFEDNIKEEILVAIEHDIKESGIEGITVDSLRLKKDTIYSLIDSLFNNNFDSLLYVSLNKMFNTTEFNKLNKLESSSVSKIEEEVGYVASLRDFKYNLQMPGLLINTNTDNIKGNQLSWQFEPVEAYFIQTDYTAESRIINIWAFVVSGIFIVVVVLFSAIQMFRRKK